MNPNEIKNLKSTYYRYLFEYFDGSFEKFNSNFVLKHSRSPMISELSAYYSFDHVIKLYELGFENILNDKNYMSLDYIQRFTLLSLKDELVRSMNELAALSNYIQILSMNGNNKLLEKSIEKRYGDFFVSPGLSDLDSLMKKIVGVDTKPLLFLFKKIHDFIPDSNSTTSAKLNKFCKIYIQELQNIRLKFHNQFMNRIKI